MPNLVNESTGLTNKKSANAATDRAERASDHAMISGKPSDHRIAADRHYDAMQAHAIRTDKTKNFPQVNHHKKLETFHLAQIKESNTALEASRTIESLLKKKVLEAIQEARMQVAAEAFGHDEGISESFDHLNEAPREPKKNTGVHERLKRHGFNYKGTKNGFRHYENSEGHEMKHKFPTLNGNHSFTHTNPAGKVVAKSANTGDTEIQNHLDKHFSIPSRSQAWKGVDEAEVLEAALNKDGTERKERAVEHPKPEHQAAFNRRWHAASGDEGERHKLKAFGFRHNYELPGMFKDTVQSKGKSSIHSFAEDEMNEELIKGKHLNDTQKKKVLGVFVHRYTGEHKPKWADKPMPNGDAYKPTHKTDSDWVKINHELH